MPESAYREGNVLEMSCVLTTGNVPEISCVLTARNVPEILLYTAPGKVKISWCRKYTRNVNFPGHFMGFPCPGNLGFLPVCFI